MSLPRIFQSVKPSNLMAMILIFIVVTFLNVAALYASSETSTIQGKQLETMKRESARPITLEEALDLSLAYGDGRKVNFAPFGLGWEV